MLQAWQTGTVSSLGIPSPSPMGSADTITKALLGNSKTGRDVVLGAATTGFFSYDTPSCGSGIGAASVGSSLKSGLEKAAIGSIPVVGKILSSFVGAIGAHHAAAVKNEQANLCRAVPDANNFLRQMDLAVQSGANTADVIAAMEQGYTQWRASVASSLKDTGGKCNATCVYEKAFRAAIEKRKLDYAGAASAQSSAANGVIGGVVNLVTGAPVDSVGRGIVSLLSGSGSDTAAHDAAFYPVPGVPIPTGSVGVTQAVGAPAPVAQASAGIGSGALVLGALFLVAVGYTLFSGGNKREG